MIESRTISLALVGLAAALALMCGCTQPTAHVGTTVTQATESEQAAEIFRYAIGMLNGLDESDAAAAQPDDTTHLALHEAVEKLWDGGTAVMVVDQLNQWIALEEPAAEWRRSDALIKTLPAALRKSMALKQLDELSFPPGDAAELRQALWLRSISNLATRQATSELDRASRLFDWTVRNIQLEPSDGSVPDVPRLAWQTIVMGRGQARDRAWVFALLARQQGLEVVQLARPAGGSDAGGELGLAAALVDGRLHLFDLALGLPLPGPDGRGVATLDQAAADDALLRRLDLDAEHPYPLKSSDFHEVVALVEGLPACLSRRMWMVESRLAGEQRLVLALDAGDLAERLRACEHVSEVRLWPFPYQRFREDAQQRRAGAESLPLVVAVDPRLVEMEPFVWPVAVRHKKREKPETTPVLWRARVAHLLGKFTGEEGANFYYGWSRPSELEMEHVAASASQQLKDMAPRGPQGQAMAEQIVQATDMAIAMMRRVKQNASYWLGLAAFDRAESESRAELYATALDYFKERTLAATPDGPWTDGAYYNLGRTYEAQGELAQACEAYRRNATSPQFHGNALRARWLEKEPRERGKQTK